MSGGILAFDLGAWTGWAHATPGAIEAWPPPVPGRVGPLEGVSYGCRHWEAPVHIPFRAFAVKMLADLRPRAVVVEAPLPAKAQKSHAAARDALQMQGALEGACDEAGVLLYEEWISTIKKHFCGTGRADKKAIEDRCRQRGWTPSRHDTADALAILDRAVWMLHLRHQQTRRTA